MMMMTMMTIVDDNFHDDHEINDDNGDENDDFDYDNEDEDHDEDEDDDDAQDNIMRFLPCAMLSLKSQETESS